MKNILESLYAEYGNKQNLYRTEKGRIDYNRNILKKSLNKHERKLLLRIIDDKDLIIEKISTDSFSNGVTVGATLMLEVLYRT